MIAGLWPKLYEEGSLEFFSDKQLEYLKYPDKTEDDEISYPKGSLLWEFGEELHLIVYVEKSQNHFKTIGTYKFYYLKNEQIMDYIRA